MRDKYGVEHDQYCYPDSDVLVNLLDIQDPQELAEAESEFSAERYRTYESRQLSLADFSFEHLQHLHHHLFQDLYEWAGQVREVDISKGSTRFCTCSRIQPEATKLFALIPNLAGLNNENDLITKVADLYCEMNILHPFREGNGRVQRFFFEELLFTLGYELRWPQISKETWIDANIAGYDLNLEPLKAIFSQAISKP
ncbi:Fic family protein [Alkalimonas collagenimarina]|uniref:protein adenylyltransferase n=1 Tax=Alkalimonas collagenimarina TaxID=400390 RepID=A0ABT9H3I3_9GAMM|nr:Fic family protein [Alkalimonas collagenimarina]MDP4537853.1 Fic family protein [Alkalimonas collagenimarina]